jgi:hypothetical protein
MECAAGRSGITVDHATRKSVLEASIFQVPPKAKSPGPIRIQFEYRLLV